VEAIRPWARDVDAFALTYDFRERVAGALGVPLSRVAVASPLHEGLLLRPDGGTAGEAAALRASLGAGEETVVLGYFGRVADNKGVVPLVRMADRLAASGRDVRLVVAGRADDPVYDAEVGRAIASSEALRGRARRLGARPRSASLYAALDLFVLCTRRDGFPLVVFEAMSTGTPVLATAVGGIAATFRDGVDAALVRKDVDDASPWTAADLARFEARLGALVADAAERRRLGGAGRARVEALVERSAFADEFLAVVGTALGRPVGARGGAP
jgi:glycosyltransferase involved in cell wall biosynthesis